MWFRATCYCILDYLSALGSNWINVSKSGPWCQFLDIADQLNQYICVSIFNNGFKATMTIDVFIKVLEFLNCLEHICRTSRLSGHFYTGNNWANCVYLAIGMYRCVHHFSSCSRMFSGIRSHCHIHLKQLNPRPAIYLWNDRSQPIREYVTDKTSFFCWDPAQPLTESRICWVCMWFTMQVSYFHFAK